MELGLIFENTIRTRVSQRVPLKEISELLGGAVYRVAGNSLNASELHDIDVYPSTKDQFMDIKTRLHGAKHNLLFVSRNAVTAMVGGRIVQFCNYFHETLSGLVDSFDFSHIQIGVEIKGTSVESLYCTEEYVGTLAGGGTRYLGSAYPLSSLIRLVKYAKRGDFTGKTWKHDIFVIFKDIVERGFVDYDDYRDQLDAVDLAYLEESGEARELFNVIKKRWIGVE